MKLLLESAASRSVAFLTPALTLATSSFSTNSVVVRASGLTNGFHPLNWTVSFVFELVVVVVLVVVAVAVECTKIQFTDTAHRSTSKDLSMNSIVNLRVTSNKRKEQRVSFESFAR